MEVGFKTQPPCVYSAYGASHPSLSVYSPLCSGSCDGTINKCFLGVFCMGVHYIGTCMSTLTRTLHTIPSLYTHLIGGFTDTPVQNRPRNLLIDNPIL